MHYAPSLCRTPGLKAHGRTRGVADEASTAPGEAPAPPARICIRAASRFWSGRVYWHIIWGSCEDVVYNGNGSFGNGAAMRVAPIIVFYHESPHLCEKAFASAEVTHSHMMAKQGAALQATAIDQALALDPGELFSFQQFMNRLLDLRLLAKLQKKIEVVQVLRENYMSCAE
jgi:hypothetical protein